MLVLTPELSSVWRVARSPRLVKVNSFPPWPPSANCAKVVDAANPTDGTINKHVASRNVLRLSSMFMKRDALRPVQAQVRKTRMAILYIVAPY